MIKLNCIDDTGQESYPFKIEKGQSYEPLGLRQHNSAWYFLIYPYPFMFIWYEERMFEPLRDDDEEANSYLNALTSNVMTEYD